jgi:hypothetical protein
LLSSSGRSLMPRFAPPPLVSYKTTTAAAGNPRSSAALSQTLHSSLFSSLQSCLLPKFIGGRRFRPPRASRRGLGGAPCNVYHLRRRNRGGKLGVGQIAPFPSRQTSPETAKLRSQPSSIDLAKPSISPRVSVRIFRDHLRVLESLVA